MSAVLLMATGSARAGDDKDGAAKGAGIPSRVILTTAKCSVSSGEIDGLAANYGDFRQWATLQTLLKAKVTECTDRVPSSESPFLVNIVRPGENLTIVVPQNERYSPNLTGVRSVYVLLLVDHHDKEEKALREFRLTSAEVPSSLLAQLPDVAKTIAGAATGGLLPAVAGKTKNMAPTDVPVQPPPPPYETVAYATVQPVPLPFLNGTLAETGTLSLYSDKDQKGSDVQVTASFTNKTKVRAEFTAIAGALVGPLAGDERMKVTDGGNYASDPLKRGVTMAAIAFHPVPFDSSLSKMSGAEKVAFLLGGVLTPAPGLGVGVSYGVVRGFAVNVGGAVVWVSTSQNNASAGEPAPKGNNQLRYGWNAGFFIGGGYVFKSGS